MTDRHAHQGPNTSLRSPTSRSTNPQRKDRATGRIRKLSTAPEMELMRYPKSAFLQVSSPRSPRRNSIFSVVEFFLSLIKQNARLRAGRWGRIRGNLPPFFCRLHSTRKDALFSPRSATEISRGVLAGIAREPAPRVDPLRMWRKKVG